MARTVTAAADERLLSSHPSRADVKWFHDGDAIVIVVARPGGPLERLLRRLLGSPENLQLRLEGPGREAWLRCDGARTVRGIARELGEAGEAVEGGAGGGARRGAASPASEMTSARAERPMEERLSPFLAQLARAGAVSLTASPSRPMDEELPRERLGKATCRACRRTTTIYGQVRAFSCPRCGSRVRVRGG